MPRAILDEKVVSLFATCAGNADAVVFTASTVDASGAGPARIRGRGLPCLAPIGRWVGG